VNGTSGTAETAGNSGLSLPPGVHRLVNALGAERLRFLVVGGINTAVGYGSFALIYSLWGSTLGYIGTLLCAHLLASSLAFVLYRRWVFRVWERPLLDYVRFQGIYAISLTVNIALLPAFIELFGWNVYLAQAVVLVITVIGSFLGHKFFSFRRPSVVRP
jgi:putative flippase GtrA